MAAETVDQQIARLQAILSSGANSATIDGVAVYFNHDSIRQQLRDLMRQKAGRRQAIGIRMSGGYDRY